MWQGTKRLLTGREAHNHHNEIVANENNSKARLQDSHYRHVWREVVTSTTLLYRSS